jgi:hypothetical protein
VPLIGIPIVAGSPPVLVPKKLGEGVFFSSDEEFWLFNLNEKIINLSRFLTVGIVFFLSLKIHLLFNSQEPLFYIN